MPGYMNNDGSELVGGLLPSGTGQALALDALGNLKTVLGNMLTAPAITEDQMRAMIVNGQGFNATTGKVTTSNANQAVSFFSPASNTKNVLLYSIELMYNNANAIAHDLRFATVDPAFPNALSVVNMKPGAATSLVNATYSTATVAASGSNLLAAPVTAQSAVTQILTNGAVLFFPTGVANGIIAFLGNTASGVFSVTFHWLEF